MDRQTQNSRGATLVELFFGTLAIALAIGVVAFVAWLMYHQASFAPPWHA